METDRLIRTLAADGARPAVPMVRAWTVAVLAAVLVAAVVFFLSIGPRPDIATAAEAAAEGARLATYRFTTYYGAARKDDPTLKEIDDVVGMGVQSM